MKKILSLMLAFVLLLAIFSAVPTVSAEETEYTVISYEMRQKYWPGILADGIVKIGDWYYGLNYNFYTKEKYINAVCGYEGNETVITIPTEIDGSNINFMNGFRLFSDTVETVIIPKEISYIYATLGDRWTSGDKAYFTFNETTNFKEIIVDTENEEFMSQDGVLFSKKGTILYFYPPKKPDIEYTVPSTVREIEVGAIWHQTILKSLTIPQSVRRILNYSIVRTLEELYFNNTNDIIGDTIFQMQMDTNDEYPNYVEPVVPHGTLYCIEGTPLYDYYKSEIRADYAYEEIKTIPRNEPETLIKEDGVWYHYDNGEKTDRYTLVKYKDKWFYVSDGIWDKTATNFFCSYKEKEFYIKNGKWDNTANGFYKINDIWRYIKNGKCYEEYQDLVKYEGKWFFVQEGRWKKTVNTLFKKNGKWFAIKSGKWYKGKSIIEYSGKKFYVNKGFVQFDYSGKVKINGKTYKIKNGKVA